MGALRQTDWVAQDRVAAAVAGPCAEVLRTIAVQPVRGVGRRRSAANVVPVPERLCCPLCGRGA